METIQKKQREIEEYRYQLREMNNHIKISLETLKESIPTYRELGMIEEEDLRYLEEITIESIDSKTFEEQIEFMKRLDRIKIQIEQATSLLEDRLKELEGMM